MSTLSQFTGGGSSIPMGSLTSQYDYSTKPLIDTPQGVYIKAGINVGGASANTLAKVKNAGMGYDVPYSACSLASTSGTTLSLGIVFGGGAYLRVSTQSLLRSTDGVTWTTVALPQLRNSVTYGITAPPVYFNGKWIMLVQGNSSTYAVNVLNSTDGLTWTVVRTLTYSASNAGAFISIANSILYISTSAYYSGQSLADIYYSDDGSTFRPCVLPAGYTGYITAVTWSGSVYFAAGTNTTSGLKSSDGITWTAQSHATTAATLFFVNNLFIISNGANNLQTSPAAGTTWTARTNAAGATIISIVFAAGLYVAGTTAGIMTSPDGITWTARTAGTNANIIFDGTIFVAAGTGTVYTSTDGITWTSRTIPYTAATTSLSSSRILNDGTTKWVIDGVGSIQKSTDGTTWTRVLSCSPATNAAANTYAMKLVNGFIFYLPTTGGIQATPSSTGSDWSIKFNSTIVFSDITFASGLYVAVGAGGAVYTSTDLATWTSRSAGASIHNVVCFGNNMFVTAGTYAGAYSSPDGITWTLRSTMAGTTSKFADYKNGQFIIGSGAFYASPDGITWGSLSVGPQLYTRTVGDVIITYGTASSGAYIINGSKILSYGGSSTFNVVGYSTITDTYYIVDNVSTVYYFVGLNALLVPQATSTASPGNPPVASAPGLYGNITPYVFAETPGSLTTMFIGTNGNGLSVNGGYFFSTVVSSFNYGYITQASTAISTADYMLVSDSSSLFYYKRDGITSNTVLLGSSTYGLSNTTAGYTAFYRRVG